MEYLDYFNRQELINERARCSPELNQLKIKREDDESVKQNVDQIKIDLNGIIQKCDERLKAQKEEKTVLDSNSSAQNTVSTSLNGEVMIQSMQKNAKMQQILDTVRQTNRLKTGDSIEPFVCGLNQLYSIEVKPQLTSLPNLETEFVNCAKGLLTYPMYTQLENQAKAHPLGASWKNISYLLMAPESATFNTSIDYGTVNCRKVNDFAILVQD